MLPQLQLPRLPIPYATSTATAPATVSRPPAVPVSIPVPGSQRFPVPQSIVHHRPPSPASSTRPNPITAAVINRAPILASILDQPLPTLTCPSQYKRKSPKDQ